MMTNININYKKIMYSFTENIPSFIAFICSICMLFYAGILLYSLAPKILEYLYAGIGELNNPVRGHP